jgi:hypothetical protein
MQRCQRNPTLGKRSINAWLSRHQHATALLVVRPLYGTDKLSQFRETAFAGWSEPMNVHVLF